MGWVQAAGDRPDHVRGRSGPPPSPQPRLISTTVELEATLPPSNEILPTLSRPFGATAWRRRRAHGARLSQTHQPRGENRGMGGNLSKTDDDEHVAPPVPHEEVDIVLHGVAYKACRKSVSISEATPLKSAGPGHVGFASSSALPPGRGNFKRAQSVNMNDSQNHLLGANRLENFRQ